MRPMFLLFLVFLVLKLCGVIAWSWWLVTLPLWFGLAALAVAVLFALVLGGGVLASSAFMGKLRKRKLR